MKNARTFAFSLALAQLALLSCGGDTPPADGTTAQSGSDETTAPVATVSREETPDSLPELDFEGKKVRILYRGDDVTRTVEAEGEETGDVVSDAVFARNIAIEERLNVDLEFTKGNANHSPFMKEVGTAILAGDDFTDIVATIQWESMPQANQGYYYNLAKAPYLDYSQPWWSNDYMSDIQFSNDTRYLLSGDISVWQLRNTSCMYFNKRIYEDSFGDPNDLYKLVLDGNWTHEKFAKYITDVWQDLNNDGKTNAGDLLGTSMTPVAQADHYTYTAGMAFSEHDKDGRPVLKKDQERNVKVVETLYKLYYETPGALANPDPLAMDGECLKHFTDGNMLFYGNRFYTTDNLRDMKDSYGMIPFPKLDEAQEDYMALVHDSTTLYGIPVTAKSIDMPCAVMEAMCAENYRKVTPAYYEVALKVKYTQDDVSAQVIDIMHDSAHTDFTYANNYSFTSEVKLGTITRILMGWNVEPSKDYMSTYDSIKSAVEKDIVDIIALAEENKR